jgi:predicted DNA-binding protein (UPF0251 family)
MSSGATIRPARGIPMTELEETILHVEEFEAIRLKDLEGLEQEECAKKMKISQPTFHRLVLSARKKEKLIIISWLNEFYKMKKY